VDTGCDQVHATVDDGIGVIVFDNPAKHNAMTAEMFAALTSVRAAFAADPAVHVVVLRGAGERAFVSGADIRQLHSGEIAAGDRPDAGAPSASGASSPAGGPATGGSPAGGSPARLTDALGKPVIAMIQGYCIGGGVVIALGADIRICSDDASFGIPAARLGVGYPHDATVTLVSLVGPGQAAEILFTGRRIGAREAERIGLVNRVVSRAELEPYVFDMARAIARNAPLSHVVHQRSIRAAVAGDDAARAEVEELIAATRASDDFREGAAAFVERRDPVFRGR
jgi:enoyl-CoA hydratase